MNCIFATHIEYRNISIQKNCQPVQKPLTLYYPHAYPPPILSHPMHALPLFCLTPCMPSPYSMPSPILYHPCMPSPYSIPPHAYPPPLFYPSPCTPSPYSIPASTHPPPVLFHPIHALPIFFPTVCMSSSVLYQPTHATPPNSLSHEPGWHVSPLTSENAAFESAHTEYIIIIYLA